jgi:hypothetical protein
VDCNFDYDGFAGYSGDIFFKWNNVKYHTPEDVRRSCPIERHIVVMGPGEIFAAGTKAPPDELTVYDGSKIDVRLKPDSPAVDAGEILPGFNDGFRGKAPDLGAFEVGDEIPWYGPRLEGLKSSTR